MRDLEAFSKKENAERKAETENINKILNAENDKRMKEAQALKDKMEKEKKELQAYLEQVWPIALDRSTIRLKKHYWDIFIFEWMSRSKKA